MLPLLQICPSAVCCHDMSDYRRGFGLVIGFVDHFNTRLVTALNYSAINGLHTAHAKSFQSAVASRFPVTDLNSGDSASVVNYTD
jgi:hypothetical protein